MGQLFSQLSTFLANPPGNLVYILAVTFAIVSSLQSAISQQRVAGSLQTRRLIFGLLVLLGLQLVLFVISGLSEQNIFQGSALLPVLDRAVLMFSLVWIIWLWAFPESSRYADAGAGLLSLLVLATGIFGLVANSSGTLEAGSFNLSSQAFYWDLGGILIVLLGFVAVFLRKPEAWGTGLAMLFLALLGFCLDIVIPADRGDYSGIVRFFMLAGFMLLMTLPSRFSFQTQKIPERKVVAENNEPQSDMPAREPTAEEHSLRERRERRRYSTDPKTLQSLFSLASDVDVDRANKDIVRSIAQALLVDLCFLLYIGDDKSSLSIASGYDLIREENLDGGMINRDNMPMLANAVLRGRSLRLPASTTSADLKGLADMLSLPTPGNLLNVPIASEKGPIGSILLLSPYSNRVWTADDQTFLTAISSSIVPILERIQRLNLSKQDGERTQMLAKDAAEQALRFRSVNSELVGQVNELKSRLEQAQAEVLHQKELLVTASQAAPAAGVPAVPVDVPVAADPHVEKELHMALAELARLQNQLVQSNARLMELESKAPEKIPADQVEVIASISQELRQPMSSIIGYADLLLGESVGILGALQRKFIERIRTSTERIGSLVDDLIQITTLEAGLLNVKPKPVDLNIVIDNAMAYTASQMREKNISMRIDIPDNLQPLYADRDALQQILIHLLQNAGSATPAEGSVTLRVHMQKENGLDCVLLQVIDTGGGIPKDDLPRVFSRLYRAENALIQGVGDTGVGLSIAKSLTEAHHGRIWVETQMGAGSAFNVSLPLETAVTLANPQGA